MCKPQRPWTIILLALCFIAILTPVVKTQENVRVVKAVCYGDAKEGKLHQLDLYLPKAKQFPVIVFAHGGAWTTGEKSEYGYLGKYLAEHGIGCAMVNYRLSPKIKHPCHVQDVARAVAWVHANIGEHGGDRGNLFLGGYSACGHLTALLATDESFLRAEGLSSKAIRGVVSISGVYAADNLPALDMIFPQGNRELHFPMKHIRPGHPAFLLFRAEKEMFGLDKQATAFHSGLRAAGCAAELHVIEGADHLSISSEAVIREQVGRRVVDFINVPALAKAGT